MSTDTILANSTNQSRLDPQTNQYADQLREVLNQVWGFDSFLPLQLDAMQAVMAGQDSLTLFPTGGGKSLCFQAPAVCLNGLAVVVSPLISLMKDQVDALQSCGVRAAFLNSSMSRDDESRVLDQIKNGSLDLIYMAPERLLTERTHDLLKTNGVSFFAIDEAHCVSEWGHDFRPEYHGLSVLKKQYPGVAVHGYTATATEQVRTDIVAQLSLVNSKTFIGSMDRPNLTYQIRRRQPGLNQIIDVLNRHKSESGIIYCISRKNVESTSAAINALGFSSRPYHAGMSPDDRKQNQEAFLREEINIIVATVAFGMGIDKSNVRYVIHASMPKSLEAYQQESGRAGRDGLDAECCMFYTAGDFSSWKRLIEQSDSSVGQQGMIQSLKSISNFCGSIECRHKTLAAHFGENLKSEDCGACDVCLNEIELVDDPLILGQKIISCVFRVDQRFGGDYVSQVLAGSRDKRILQNGHDKLSTYGLLESENKRSVRVWIEQLISQDFLEKVGEYNVLKITEKGSQLLRGETKPRLAQAAPVASGDGSSSKSTASWEGVDKDLFEVLREMRSGEAKRQEVPAYVVFSDASLRDMARRRPATLENFRMLNGVGQKKLDDYGQMFLDAILQFCQSNHVETDVVVTAPAKPATPKSLTASALAAFPHFENGLSIAEVAKLMGRAESTTSGYLNDYIQHHKIIDASRWVDAETIAKTTAAIKEVGIGPLKPVFVTLDEKVPYDQIRIVMACLTNAKD